MMSSCSKVRPSAYVPWRPAGSATDKRDLYIGPGKGKIRRGREVRRGGGEEVEKKGDNVIVEKWVLEGGGRACYYN